MTYPLDKDALQRFSAALADATYAQPVEQDLTATEDPDPLDLTDPDNSLADLIEQFRTLEPTNPDFERAVDQAIEQVRAMSVADPGNTDIEQALNALEQVASVRWKDVDPMEVDDSLLDVDESLLASGDIEPTGPRWAGVIGVEGEMTGDGRLIEHGALKWEVPLPLRHVSSDVGAHDGAQVVGRILSVERLEDGRIWGEGDFDSGSDIGVEAYRQAREQLNNGISMDLDDVAFEVRVAAEVGQMAEGVVLAEDGEQTQPVETEVDEDGRVTVQRISPDDEVRVTTSGRLRAATIVAIPAFASARIEALSDDDSEQASAYEADTSDDSDAEEQSDADLAEMVDWLLEDDPTLEEDAEEVTAAARETFNWVDDVGGLPRYIKRISKHLRAKGKTKSHAIAIAVNVVKKMCATGDLNYPGKQSANAGSRAQACKAVAEWEAKKARAKATSAQTVTASGPSRISEYRPPAEWFDDPALSAPTGLTITSDGRIYGHLAEWGTCHISHTTQGQCLLPPTTETDYAYFHTGSVLTKDGSERAVGRITLGTGHADEMASPTEALRHYDNTGTAAAFVAAGEDAHGIWVAGALAPGLSEREKVLLRASPLSGDWRRMGTNLELVAALAVNVAGFPVPRVKGMVAAGHMTSLIASGMLTDEDAADTGDTPVTQPEHTAPDTLSPRELRYLRTLADEMARKDVADMRRRVTTSDLAVRRRRAR